MSQQALFAEPSPRFPKRWQDCSEFCAALEKRGYIATKGRMLLFMSDGLYLYLYKLWQDGSSR